MEVEGTSSGMQLIIAFLKDQVPPGNKNEAHILEEKLYISFSMMMCYVKEASAHHSFDV